MNDEPTEQTRNEDSDLTIRVPPALVSGLRRRHLRVAAVLLVLIVAVALIFGLGLGFGNRGGQSGRDIEPPRGDLRPLKLNDLPGRYDQLPAPAEPPRDKTADVKAHGGTDAAPLIQQQNDELRQTLSQLSDAVRRVDGENKRLQDQLARYADETTKEQARVWASELFFKLDDRARGDDKPVSSAPDGLSGGLSDAAAVAALTRAAPPPQPENAPTTAPTDQQRKLAFLNQPAAEASDLDRPYLWPRSEYQLQAGTIIPAALLTGINTDLPGDVIAVVTRPVYDSRAGRYLLIPQGAKLYGSYDSEVANGQDRALLVWHRLLMPNGRSIQLDRMKGTDVGGYAGVADRVDYHADKLTAGVALSSVIAYAGNLARGRHAGGTEDARDVVGDTVAQEANRIGSKIVDRQLDVQPTITIRPGWPVLALVNRDVTMEPYTD